eukprot:962898-Prorocentrum_minimum.AAC.1
MGTGTVARLCTPLVRRVHMHIDNSGEEQYSAASGVTPSPSRGAIGDGRPHSEPLSGAGMALH